MTYSFVSLLLTNNNLYLLSGVFFSRFASSGRVVMLAGTAAASARTTARPHLGECSMCLFEDSFTQLGLTFMCVLA